MTEPAQETLHIATAVDEAYLIPLKIMLGSMKENLNASFRPVLHLLNRSLRHDQLKSVDSLVETRSIVPDGRLVESMPSHSAFPPEAAFPLLLPDVLPDSVERVLFLDPDLLVLDDIAKIWKADLGDDVIAAAVDQAIPFASSPRGVKNRREMGVPDTAPYFNAGVMLIDIARWRRHDVTARARRYLDQVDGRADYYHQEALNAVLWNDWLTLDQRWNLIASFAGRRYGPEKSSAVVSPGIVHFAGYFKPWRFRVGGPFASTYDTFSARYTESERRHPASLKENLISIYDRYLRDYLYGFERELWNRRLI